MLIIGCSVLFDISGIICKKLLALYKLYSIILCRINYIYVLNLGLIHTMLSRVCRKGQPVFYTHYKYVTGLIGEVSNKHSCFREILYIFVVLNFNYSKMKKKDGKYNNIRKRV